MTAERWMPRWLFPTVLVAVLAPIVVAVMAQRHAHWHPVYDLAMTELRVRDVGGRHTPLIGLQGRIGPTGSHPGPLSFYLLAPVYRLFGSSAWALQVATAALHAAAAATALVVVRRRQDGRILLACAVLLLLLMQGYGLGPLTEPWNPYLPLLWFVAFLVSVWGATEGDLVLLVPAVVAGSICAQTHVPYLPVTLGVGAIAVVIQGIVLWRGDPARRGANARWLVVAAAAGLVLWMPPLIDEVVHEPGNLTQLVDHLGGPDDAPIGIRSGARLMAERLDGWQLVVGEWRHPGTYVRTLSGPGPVRSRGVATAVAWTLCVLAAALLRHRRLLVLHGVIAGSMVIGVASIARIYGIPWHYLMLWAFGIGALMVLSIGGTIVVALERWHPRLRTAPSATALRALGVSAMLVLSARVLALAPEARTDTPDQTAQLRELVPATVAALDAGVGASTGHDGRYLVYWDDAVNGGSEGIGMVNELVRRGFHVSVVERDAVKIAPYRVRSPEDVTARVVVASGGWIEHWAAEPGARRVAYDDPRTPEERREFLIARGVAIAALVDDGRPDLVERLDTDLFNIALNEGIGVGAGLALSRLIDLGVPAAVFVLPPGPIS